MTRAGPEAMVCGHAFEIYLCCNYMVTGAHIA